MEMSPSCPCIVKVCYLPPAHQWHLLITGMSFALYTIADLGVAFEFHVKLAPQVLFNLYIDVLKNIVIRSFHTFKRSSNKNAGQLSSNCKQSSVGRLGETRRQHGEFTTEL